MEAITFDQMPAAIGEIYAELKSIRAILANQTFPSSPPLSKHVDINGASVITSKSPNALRVQISLGNLKSTKKGSRHYFEREYLERWIAGDENEKGASK